MDTRPDDEVYAELEQRYLETRDQDAYWNMYLLIHRYEKRLIRKYCRNNGLFKPTDEVNDLAGDMALWFMEQYKRPDFKAKSMSAYGGNAFLKIMFQPNRKAEELRAKVINNLPPVYEYDENLTRYELETPTERSERWHQERVSKNHSDTQGILPFEEWEPEQ